jgi:hypothetical protein
LNLAATTGLPEEIIRGELNKATKPLAPPITGKQLTVPPEGARPSLPAKVVGAVQGQMGEELAGEPTTKLSPEAESAVASLTQKGTPDASTIPSPESVTQPEVRPQVGEATPLRQQGEAPGAQGEVQDKPLEAPGVAPTRAPPAAEAKPLPPPETIPPKPKADTPANPVRAKSAQAEPEKAPDAGKAAVPTLKLGQSWTLRRTPENPSGEWIAVDKKNVKLNQPWAKGYFGYQFGKTWYVVEPESGLSVGKGSTLAEARLEANKNLSATTPEKVAALAKSKTEGLPPKPATPQPAPEKGPGIPGTSDIGQGPGGMTKPARKETPETYSGTGLKNAVAALERLGLSLRKAPENIQRNMVKAWNDAGDMIAADPLAGQTLADEIVANPERGVTDTDSALLLRHKVDLLNRLNDAAERSHTGDAASRSWATDEHIKLKGEFTDLLDAIKKRGSEWGREGRWRQALATEEYDFSTTDGWRKAYKEDTGQDLTPSQEASVKVMADRLKAAQAAAEEAKKKLAAQPVEPPVDPKRKAIFDKAISFLGKAADDALARIKARRAAGKAFSGPANPEDLDDYVIYGAAKIAKGVVEKGQWAAEMAADIGDYIKPYLNQIWDMTDTMEKQLSKITDQKTVEAVKKVVRKQQPMTLDDVKKALSDHQQGKPFTPDQLKALWSRVKDYVNQGHDNEGEIVNNIATETGLPANDVLKGLAQNKPMKRIADDVWHKQREVNRLKQGAKRWVNEADKVWLAKAVPKLARLAFGAKTALHGTVAMGTHAALTAFSNPIIFKDNFGVMYHMVVSPDYHLMKMAELMRDPDWIKANRAGLVNDPRKFEDFNNPEMAQQYPALSKFFKNIPGMSKLPGMGNRGYSVLKLIRQDLFDKHWNSLDESQKTPEMAKAISESVNHITGVTKMGSHPGANMLLFAPKLWLSRFAVVAGDPVKAGLSLMKGKNMTDAEKWFASNQIKQAAKILGVWTSLLAANQVMNNTIGKKDKINGVPKALGGGGFDPMKSDFLKFKADGMRFAWGGPFLTLMRFPIRIIEIHMSDGGKLKHLIYPDESMANTSWEYLRSQLSPISADVADVVTKTDYSGRPLPKLPWGAPQPPVPKRLAAQGIKPYTWPEYGINTILPIPFEEAAKEVFHYGVGGTPEQQQALYKALITWILMSGTGGRVQEDWPEKE